MLECVLSNNGVRMYFLEGKHVSREYMNAYATKLGKKLPQCRSITENTKLIRLKKKVIYLRIKLNEILSNSKTTEDKNEFLKQIFNLEKEVSTLKETISIEKGKYDKVVQDLKLSFEDNEKLKSIISDNETKMLEMKNRETDLIKIIQKLEIEKSTLETSLNSTLGHLKESEDRVKNLNTKMVELESIINTLKSELEHEKELTLNALKENSNNSDLVEQTINNLNFKLSEYEVMVKTLKDENEKLQDINSKLIGTSTNNGLIAEQRENQIQELEKKIIEYTNRLDSLESENYLLKSNETVKNTEIENKEKELELLKTEIQSLKQGENIKTVLQNKQQELEKEIITLKGALDTKEQEIQNERKVLEGELLSLKADLEIKDQEIQNERKILETKDQEIQNEKKILKSELLSLKGSLENKEQESANEKRILESEMLTLKSALETKEQEIQNERKILETKDQEIQNEKKNLEGELLTLKGALETKDKEIQNERKVLEGELLTLKGALETKEQEIQNERKVLEGELLTLKGALETKEQEIQNERNSLKGELSTLRGDIETKKQNMIKRRQALRDKIKASKESPEEIISKEQELDNLKTQVDSLKEDINIVKSDLTPEVDEVEKTICEQKKLLESKKFDINIDIKDVEKITDDVKQKITQLRNDNMNSYLESLSLSPDAYPILLKIYDNTKKSQVSFSGTIPLILYITKSLLVTTRLFTRNPIFMRLISLDNEDFKELLADEKLSVCFKDIIEELYYTNISDDYISETLPELESMVKNKTFYKSKNQLYLGLKSPLYDKLIIQILNDSKTGIKRVNTVFFLNTIIKLLTTLSSSSEKEIKQYSLLISMVINIVRNNIQRNELLIKIQNIVLQTSNEKLKTFHNKNTNIFTFIRLRSNDVNDINARFNIKMDQEEKTIFIGYDPTIKPLYENNKLVENPRYRDNYIFGPFTKIFKPYLTNKEIADDSKIQILIERLKNKKPVMIIGYGASGSGKTSTLINFFDKNLNVSNPGIMMYMSDKLQSDYNTIEVSFIELEGDIKSDNPIRDVKVIPSNDDVDHIYRPQKFIIENGEWVIDKDTFNIKLEDEENKKKGIDIDKNTSLKYYIATILDKARNVKATTNNPESSRSHMLVFVNFINDKGENVYLIICDFAGVENVFNCLNPEVLDKFINIKDRKNNRFYKDVLDKSIEEKLGNTLEELEKSKKQPLSDTDKLKFTASKEKINLTLEGIKEIKNLFLNKNPGKQDGLKDEDKPVRVIAGPSDVALFKQSKYRTIINMIFEKMYSKKIPEDYSSLNNAIIESFKLNKDNLTKLKLFQNAINLEKSKFINIETADLICKNRVKEGLFINDSLEKLRTFIADFIVNVLNKDKSTVFPPFFDSCVPYQCNPYFEDCFGSSNEQETVIKSFIMDQIKSKICDTGCNIFKELNIVVFNVLNLSKEANNPPPIPYTDLTGLTTELNRLKTIKSNDYLKDEYFSDEKFVRKMFLDDIENRDTIKQFDPTAQKQVTDLIAPLRDSNKSIEQQILNLNRLINFINRINAVTSIGTMEFADMISKFGLNKTTCNYMLENEDVKPLLVDLPEKVRDEILNKLNTQRSVLLALFDNLFVQSYFK